MKTKNFPDFLGIGAQKAGTTWLYENLKEHPEIGFPPVKEVHFWDIYYERGLEWYEALFTALPQSVKGEITPAYAILPQEKIAEIAKLNPALKIIYILRDPVERAWSAALMDMGRAGLEFTRTPDQWFIDNFDSPGSAQRGDYETCLRNWLGFFPRKNILVMQYEDIKHTPYDFLKQCARHIGASTIFFEKLESAPVKKAESKVFAGKNYPIRPALKKYLEEKYSTKSSNLANFLKNI